MKVPLEIGVARVLPDVNPVMSLSIGLNLLRRKIVPVLLRLHIRELVDPPNYESRDEPKSELQGVTKLNVVDYVFFFYNILYGLLLIAQHLNIINRQQVNQHKVHNDVKLHKPIVLPWLRPCSNS